MTKTVVVVRSDVDAEEAWQIMREARIHHLVVVDDDQIVGVVSDRDLGGPRGTTVRYGQRVVSLMSTFVVAARPAMKIRDAARLMRVNTFGCMPVVENKKLIGMITSSDLVAYLADRDID